MSLTTQTESGRGKKGIAHQKPQSSESSGSENMEAASMFPAVKFDLICFYYADAFKRIREGMR